MKKGIMKKAAFASVLAAALQLSVCSVSAASDYEAGDYARIYINTKSGNGNQLEKADGYEKAEIAVVSAADENGKHTVLSQSGKIKVRGNSTSLAEKKPFNIKFDKKQNVLGMGSGKKWCLLANCFDPSLMRNYVAFETARELGLAYTPDISFAEVWLDDTFKGCYLVAEPIESGSARIDIDTDADDFMIEFEAYRDEELVSYITSDNGSLRFAVSEPEMPDPSDYKADEAEIYKADLEAYNLRIEEISDKINYITETVKNGSYDEMCEVIDMDSFVDYYVLNEIMKTCDFGWSSVNFYYSDGKLHAGPAWDYDLSSGNTNTEYPSLVTSESEKAYTEKYADFETNSSPEGMYAADCNFYVYLTANDEFMNDVKDVFLEEQDYINNLVKDGGMLDSIYSENAEMFERNFVSAENGGAGWVVSKSYADTMRIPDSTYEENYKYFRNWLSARNDYLYEAWIGHDFSEGDICKHCGINIDDCSVAGHRYDGNQCSVCGEKADWNDRLVFTEGLTYGKTYSLKDCDYTHICGVRVRFAEDVSSDFSGAAILGNYAVSGSINSCTCSGNVFEFAFSPESLWSAPDSITVQSWGGAAPEITEIEFIYSEDAEAVIPESSVLLVSEDNRYDISAYDKSEITSVTFVLRNEVYNGGGQIVFDNWSSSSFNLNRAAGKTVTVNVSNVSDVFSINFWGASPEIECVILNFE